MAEKLEGVYHILTYNEWHALGEIESYHPKSLDNEGFIHLSYKHQLPGVIHRFYSGEEYLYALKIDPKKLLAPLKVDQVAGEGSFPHLYGELNMDAVIHVYGISIQSNGDLNWKEPEA